MSGSTTITIPHLGRVEGHGGIAVTIAGRQVRDVNMDIYEGSRYYEALLVGKHYLEVQGIITRVCAICSADHSVASLTALEHALGVVVTERVGRLRELLLLGAAIESHALHVFALALPDLLGFDSILSMAEVYPEEVTAALRLKQLGNRIQELVGGRPVHPVNTLIGGFGRLPDPNRLGELRDQLAGAVEQAMRFVELAATVEVPSWAAHPTVFLALQPDGAEYGFCGSSIRTSLGEERPTAGYRDLIREFTVEGSRAKHAALPSGEGFMVGALARLSLWGDRLGGGARDAFRALFANGAEHNILLNNWAQLVEIVFSLERAIEICDELVRLPGDRPEPPLYVTRAGRGIAALEAPRGTLFHEYELDRAGKVVAANVITPTAQNLANTERDLRTAAENLLAAGVAGGDAELRLGLELVARAYDPCISCSVHVVRVEP